MTVEQKERLSELLKGLKQLEQEVGSEVEKLMFLPGPSSRLVFAGLELGTIQAARASLEQIG